MCVCVLACQNCLFPCNRVVYLSVVSCLILISKFKQLNLAEKTRSKFRTRPSGVRRGSVREGPMHRSRNIYHSVLIKISSCAFFLDSTGNVIGKGPSGPFPQCLL